MEPTRPGFVTATPDSPQTPSQMFEIGRREMARKTGVRGDLSVERIADVSGVAERAKSRIEKLRKEQGDAAAEAERLKIIKAAYETFKSTGDSDPFLNEKSKKILEGLGGTGIFKALKAGVAKGVFGREAGQKIIESPSNIETAAAGALHPMAEGAGYVAEKAAEWVPALRAAGKVGRGAVAGVKALAKGDPLKNFATFLAKAPVQVVDELLGSGAKDFGAKAVVRGGVKGAVQGAPTFGVTGAAIEAKDELVDRIATGDPVEMDKILAEGGVQALLGGLFGAFGGAIKPALKTRVQAAVKKHYGFDDADLEAIRSGRADDATIDKLLEKQATLPGVQKIFQEAPDDVVKELAAREAQGRMFPTMKGRPVSAETEEILGKEMLPVSTEAGTKPLSRLEQFFLRSRGTPELTDASGRVKGKAEVLKREAEAYSREFDNIYTGQPVHVKEAIFDVLNGTANPAKLQALTVQEQAKVAGAAKQIESLVKGGIATGQARTAAEAQAAGTVEPEFFERVKDWQRRSFMFFEHKDFMPAPEVRDRFVTSIYDNVMKGPKGVKTAEALGIKAKPVEFFEETGISVTQGPEAQAAYKDWLGRNVDSMLMNMKADVFAGGKQTGQSMKGLKAVRRTDLEARKDLSPEWKELLGEIKDPRVNFELSLNKLNNIFLRSNFINEMSKVKGLVISPEDFARDQLLEQLPRPTLAPGEKLADALSAVRGKPLPEGEGYGKLAGHYVTAAPGSLDKNLIDEVLYGEAISAVNSNVVQFLDQANRHWKWINTVGNVFSHPRNFFGNTLLAAMTNSIPLVGKKAGAAMKMTLDANSDYILGRPMTKHKYWLELLERGQIETEQVSGELIRSGKEGARTFEKAWLGDFSADPLKNSADSWVLRNLGPQIDAALKKVGVDKMGQAVKAMKPTLKGLKGEEPLSMTFDKIQEIPVVRVANRIYNTEDQFFKLNLYSKLRLNGMEADQAAAAVDRYFPNYSAVSTAVQGLRRVPIAGAFVTFKAEMARVLYNHAEDAAIALAKGDARPAAKFIATMGAPLQYKRTLGQMSGISDKEQAELEANAPAYNKNAYYYRDMQTGQVQGLNLGSFIPHSDWLTLYDLFSKYGAGKIDLQTFGQGVQKNLYGLDEWWPVQGIQFWQTGQTAVQKQKAFEEGAPALAYSPEVVASMSPEERAAQGTLGAYTTGAKGPELAKYFGKQFFVPSFAAGHTAARFGREAELHAQGMTTDPEYAANFFGLRRFNPKEEGAIAKTEAGKVVKKAGTGLEERPEDAWKKELEQKAQENKLKLHKMRRGEVIGTPEAETDTGQPQ